jgi:cbb3-type cytochrome c oxidase subunit III
MQSLLHKKMTSVGRATMLVACLVLWTNALADGEQESTRATIDDPQVASAWRALRILNCERCHGKHYEGLSAPSVVAYVRDQSREMFFRMLLDGDPPRGMPGYRNNALVSKNIDGIYRYFTLRANGTILASSRPKSD